MNWASRMREDWDRRGREDAEHFIYTQDAPTDVAGFLASGQANYSQLVRPYLPLLLDGRPAREARAIEIGCGAGRMTACFARDFSWVEALDVSPVMIEAARSRLSGHANVTLHVNSGEDLAPIADASADLVFSYLVFQHIPAREVVENYIAEAARVLRPGGAFKFQVHGDRSPEYLRHPRDTWQGETFSEAEMRRMLARRGFSVTATEGAGTQYFVITARKGPQPRERPYVLAGEDWAAPLLLEGFGASVEHSWRPMGARARVHVPGRGPHIYLDAYFWPDGRPCRLTLAGRACDVAGPGDCYFECAGDPAAEDIEISLQPPPGHAPAFRIIGRY
jgi:SAM-dependent methyltransferase